MANKFFINDLKLNRPLTLGFFRATIINGEIMRYSLPDRLPENAHIFSLEDLPQKEIDILGYKIPLLCGNWVNYQGEPIFLIAAENRQDLKNISDSINIEFRPSTPYYFDMDYRPEQIFCPKEFEFTYEDIKFQKENTYTIETETSGDYFCPEYNDTVGVAAEYNGKTLTVYAPTQWPFHVRQTVAGMLDMAPDDVIVRVTEMTAPMEGRLWYSSYLGALAAFAAYKTGRPVKLLYSPDEVRQFIPSQYPFRIRHTSTLEKNTDRLLECDVQIEIATGAYPLFSNELIKILLTDAFGQYKIPKIKIHERLIKTSTPSMSFITGINFSQILTALENHINVIISRLDASPMDWRKNNIRSSFSEEIIDNVLAESDYLKKYSFYELLKKRKSDDQLDKFYTRGIGMAMAYCRNKSLSKFPLDNSVTCSLTMDSDRNITLSTATVPQYYDEYTFWKEIINAETSVPVEKIFISSHDTDRNCPSCPDIFNNTFLPVAGTISNCCRTLMKKAAEGVFPVTVTCSSENSEIPDENVWGSAVVEVSVDTTTYKPAIRGIWISMDRGKVLSEELLKKDIKQKITSTLLWLTEPLNTGYATSWKFADLPININLIKNSKIQNPCSCGDMANALISAAYSSAVSQAIGKNIFSYPITHEKIYRLVEGTC
ncbi:MAG: molybdopterin-dependent oxidoreductase [Spirochaetia bacterium]|nr:molybdopterin-dependent oxidoreductase [Spirochaetia bacterium]